MEKFQHLLERSILRNVFMPRGAVKGDMKNTRVNFCTISVEKFMEAILGVAFAFLTKATTMCASLRETAR